MCREKGANRGYREEMLAVMEKEVKAVSLLSRELSPTLPQVSQQEMSRSIRKERTCKDLGQSQSCVLHPPATARDSSPKLTWSTATLLSAGTRPI